MAHGKGLHRQPAKSWGLPESEVLQRNWLWWTIYCLDKQLAFRSGRPSAIDDENISAEIPKVAPVGSTMDVEIVTNIIRHAQISTQISRRIMSVTAFKQSLPELIATVRDVHRQLEVFKQSLPVDIQIEDDSVPVQDRQLTSRFIHLVYIRFAFYGSMMAAHIPFFYPWIAARFRAGGPNPELDEQIEQSSAAVATAARQIILTLRSLTVNVAVPAWLAFYYPMYAHINLFLHILEAPHLPSTTSDLALLDVSAGHFGYMAFATSELSFPFAKESALLAYKMVRLFMERKDDNDAAETMLGPTWRSNSNRQFQSTQGNSDTQLAPAGYEQTLNLDAMNSVGFLPYRCSLQPTD